MAPINDPSGFPLRLIESTVHTLQKKFSNLMMHKKMLQ
jgi:hypothetical protein